jgi:hypothetical protein
MKNSPSRFDNLWLFYLGEPAAPHLVGELRYLQLTSTGLSRRLEPVDRMAAPGAYAG